MASKTLFGSARGTRLPEATSWNEEGGRAYARPEKQALAQYVATGCLNDTFYASADTQLDTILALAARVDSTFLARTALYGRAEARMKDAPALLCAILSTRAPELLSLVFPRVIDSGRMLRSFVQIVRSGVVGRRSLGTVPKRLVVSWLDGRDDEALFTASVGQSPSLADVIRMVHPRPRTARRQALYGYLIGKEVEESALPPLVTSFEAFKRKETARVPDVPFEMLTSLDLGAKEWRAIAENASWQMTRMNLNTFARHGVFDSEKTVATIARRLRNPELVKRARPFPYQLLAAHAAAGDDVPAAIKGALHDAMELAIANVPPFDGKVYVCPDVSGSMSSPVTGHRKDATSAVRCIDVAALVAAAVLRKSHDAEVLPFEQRVRKVRLDPRDTVLTNANKLAAIGGGGTACSAPLAELNGRKAKGDLVILVSDNESWVDASRRGATAVMTEWAIFRARNPRARLVCIDLQPSSTTQAPSMPNVLNVGGFSDAVFAVVAEVASGKASPDHWVDRIESMEL